MSEDILLPRHGIVNEYNRRRRALRGISNTRKHNGAQIALARKYPGMMPIATVHPHDGPDSIAELERVAHGAGNAKRLFGLNPR